MARPSSAGCAAAEPGHADAKLSAAKTLMKAARLSRAVPEWLDEKRILEITDTLDLSFGGDHEGPSAYP